MTGDNEDDDDIASDVLPELVEEQAVPLKLDKLCPWHKPRKQFIRERQWVALSRRLIESLQNDGALPHNTSGQPEVKYLTLPGTDYLDVRLLADLCAELDCDLTITGFLAEAEGNPYHARAQVRQESLIKAGYITDNSQTYWRRIEEIGTDKSVAYLELRNRSPFQVVNIDACGSLALPNAEHAHRIIDAVYRIVETQLSRTTNKWLLFLTTDVRRENLRAETLQKITDAIRQNAETSTEFASETCELIDSECNDIEQAIANASQDDSEQFLSLFALGIAKWLLHLAGGKNWGVKMHSSHFYSSAPYPHVRPTMPCLAFEFLPPPASLTDPFQVTNAQPAPGNDHDGQSMRAVSKVRNMSNLDARLAENPQLARELIDSTRLLLEEAGYTATALSELHNLAGIE